jgi:hypothetical protein
MPGPGAGLTKMKRKYVIFSVCLSLSFACSDPLFNLPRRLFPNVGTGTPFILDRKGHAAIYSSHLLSRTSLRGGGQTEAQASNEDGGSPPAKKPPIQDSEPIQPSNATKSSAKAARKDAERAAKSRPCPDGAALLAAGDEAYRAGRWADAKLHFAAAAARHRAAAKAPPAANPAPRPAAADPAPPGPAAARLILSDPAGNLQAKPLRGGVAPELNYARNSPEVLAAFLAKFGPGYRTRFPPEPNGCAAPGPARPRAASRARARRAARRSHARAPAPRPAHLHAPTPSLPQSRLKVVP